MENSRTRPAPSWKRRIARTMMGVTGLFVVFLLAAWWRLVTEERHDIRPTSTLSGEK